MHLYRYRKFESNLIKIRSLIRSNYIDRYKIKIALFSDLVGADQRLIYLEQHCELGEKYNTYIH